MANANVLPDLDKIVTQPLVHHEGLLIARAFTSAHMVQAYKVRYMQ